MAWKRLDADRKSGDEGKRVSVLASDAIEAPVVDAKAQSAVFLFGEKDGGTMRRLGRVDAECSVVRSWDRVVGRR